MLVLPCLWGFGWALSTLRSPYEFRYAGAWPFFQPLPFAAMSGFTPWQLSSHLLRLVFLLPATVLAAVALARVRVRARAWPTWAVFAGVALALVLIARFVTHGTPLTDDEATYLMQAAPLAHGHLFDGFVPPAARWAEAFTVFSRTATSGKYLFGEPLLLVPGLWLGWPLLGPWLAALATLLVAYRQSTAEASPFAARLGLLLFAACPAFLLTSPTPLSEVPALLGCVIGVIGLSRPPAKGGALSGVGIGLALICRPQVALPAAIALLLSRRWEPRRFLFAAITGLPFLAAILLYDHALSGHALLLPWALAQGERFGFGRPWPDAPFVFTPRLALEQVGVALVRLNGFALGWPVSLAGPVAYFALGRPHWSWVRPWLLLAVSTFAFQFFWYTTGPSETGPLYHYPALPFVAFSTAAAIEALATTRWRSLVFALLVANLALGTGTFLIEHGLRLRRFAAEVRAPYEGLPLPPRALVVIDVSQSAPAPGFFFGVLERTRQPGDARVEYPYASLEQVAFLRSLWSDRPCEFLLLLPDGRRELASCDEATRLEQERARVDRTPPPAPRIRWQSAFRWVPFVAR